MHERRRYLHLPMLVAFTLASSCQSNQPEKSDGVGSRGAPAAIDHPPPPSKKPILADAEIEAFVEASFVRDPGITDTGIQVTTTDGIVELTGSVGDLLTKRRAVRVAEAVKGVRAVSDRLKLEVPYRPDSELARHVRSALLLDTAIQSTVVNVAADDGSVTLTGSVRSYQQRDLCQKRAEAIVGVREVDNQLRIAQGAARSDAEIASDVASRLRWDALIDDRQIRVDVRDGVVTMTGQVASIAERRRAAADAWVLGAKVVNDSALAVKGWAQEHDLTKDRLLGMGDTDIAKAILAAAAYDPRLSAARMQVEVVGGAATLRGSVGSYSGKLVAEELAHNTVGVTEVKNHLIVRPTKAIADSAVKRAVRSALLWNPYTNGFDIDVDVKRGAVRLTGRVNTPFARTTAPDVVSNIAGVLDVDNELSVKHTDVANASVSDGS